MYKFLIADDHSIVRRGIIQILLEAYPNAHIEEVANVDDLIAKIMKSNWDMVISDLSMPGRNGLDALPQIQLINPNLPVLIMSIHPEDQYAVRVLKAGASGYLSKDLAPEELITAVQRVLSGRKYITAPVAEKLIHSMHNKNNDQAHQTLSDREFAVFILLAKGTTISEIAEAMHLSPTTVSTYRSRILQKMDMKGNAELTVYSVQHNLI
jgi:two-component system invasion response regulator UvrY